MIIEVGTITKALSKISAFASGEKSIPGVMFDIGENELKICYSDNRKCLIETLEVQTEDTDKMGKVVFDYEKLSSIIAVCQPTGKIAVKEIQFRFEDKNIVKVRAEKMIAERASEEEEPEYKVFSVYEQSIGWLEANANIKVSILTRAKYDNIFKCDVPDVWDTSELKNILNKLSSEKGKIVYLSPRNNIAFVANTAYAGTIVLDREHDMERRLAKIKGDEENPDAVGKYKYAITMSTVVAKAVADILSKIEADNSDVFVHTAENKICYIYTGDNKFGISIEMVDGSQMNVNTIKKYQNKQYNTYQLTLNKEVFCNVIQSAMAAGKMDKTVIKFGTFTRDESMTAMKITSIDGNASVKNEYEVACSGCMDLTGNIYDAELPISLKIVSDVANTINTDYMAIDIDIDETGTKFIRIADVDIEAKMMMEGAVTDLIGDNEVSSDEQLEIRTYYTPNKYYTISAK